MAPQQKSSSKSASYVVISSLDRAEEDADDGELPKVHHAPSSVVFRSLWIRRLVIPFRLMVVLVLLVTIGFLIAVSRSFGEFTANQEDGGLGGGGGVVLVDDQHACARQIGGGGGGGAAAESISSAACIHQHPHNFVRDAKSGWRGDNNFSPRRVRMLILVASSCCLDESARAKRHALRKSWIADAYTHFGPGRVIVRFALGSPKPTTNNDTQFVMPETHADALAKEIVDASKLTAWYGEKTTTDDESHSQQNLLHGDVVVLPAPEGYRNLPLKTRMAFAYAMAHPAEFTHILKVDDDVYVRITHLLMSATVEASVEEMTLDDKDDNKAPIPLALAMSSYTPYFFRAVAATARAAHALPPSIQARPPHPIIDPAVVSDLRWMANHVSMWWPPSIAPARMYVGRIENRGGFQPMRIAQGGKWTMSKVTFPDRVLKPIRNITYASGWGYFTTRDVVQTYLSAVRAREAKLMGNSTRIEQRRREPMHQGMSMAPLDSVGANEVSRTWWQYFPWEDVDFGITLHFARVELYNDRDFKAAWSPCTKMTSVKHLDVEAPALVIGLHEQERSGLWSHNSVQCVSGPYAGGDYGGWYRFSRAIAEHDVTYDAWPAEMLAANMSQELTSDNTFFN
ncbi:N-acetyllactosaminide beta-1,3-N-acetylglucosaminyltransferase [Pycnococcus provasolii]|mmetsp:Transcript_16023/g.40745  ORF Transcript_16023/g.40745 Transcript_16023/m.40745 type:complete len:626 (+) Transcript_16023:56-1933(+)